MKKKKKKSAVALLKKRKKFGGLFLRRWIGILILSVLLWNMVRDNVVDEAFEHEKIMFQRAEDAIMRSISKEKQEGADDIYYNQLKYHMAVEQETGTASILYKEETGEVIVDCQENIFIFEGKDEKNTSIYTCPTKDIPGWEAYWKENVRGSEWYDFMYTDVEIDYVYLNGKEFLPGKMKVKAMRNNEDKGTSEVVFSKVFEEPENIPSGYIKTEWSENWNFFGVFGYRDSDLLLYGWNAKSYELLQKYYKTRVEDGHPGLSGEGYYGKYEMDLSGVSRVTLSTGETAVLLTARYYDAWEQYGNQFLLLAVIELVAGGILAFVWAKISYMKLKAQYDMVDYRNTLMNTMAHDLKSPLMSISGYAENLQQNINTGKNEYYADAILSRVSDINRIIESILMLSKTENEKIVLNKTTCNMAKLVAECAKKYELQRKDKNLEVTIEGEVELNIDTFLFAQAMDNLIGNAVKYASAGSTIHVVIGERAISVTNKCDKMPEVDTDTLCEAFVVGSENRSNRSGSGLGLAIVQNICTLHKFGFEIECMDNEFVAKVITAKKR